MENAFFNAPILNSPYDYPARHWELNESGQPTQLIIEKRRDTRCISPIPRPRKQKSKPDQKPLTFGDGAGFSSDGQAYDPTPIIKEIRYQVDAWRKLPKPSDWHVTPETARLLQHWRHTRSPVSALSSARSKLPKSRSGLLKSRRTWASAPSAF